jgi:hypothetical protein
MNERIKLLADRASDYAGDRYKAISPLPDWNQYEPTWHRDYTEQLAELVVKECMRLNSTELSITAIERLLPLYQEHFGVAE